ncbi:MAG: hypothetical protein IJR00_11640 [Lachnospiraceae bacterium]|nr:hypothetical protein [Lachnospiraceae bacterium]
MAEQKAVKKKRKKKHRFKKSVRVFLTILASVAGVLLLTVFVSEFFIRVEMPQDTVLSLEYLEDGSIRLSWPEVPGANAYQVDALRVTAAADGKSKTETLYSEACTGAESFLPNSLLMEPSVLLQVNPERAISPFGKKIVWKGRRPLLVRWVVREPQLANVNGSVDENAKTLDVWFDHVSEDGYALFVAHDDGSREIIRSADPPGEVSGASTAVRREEQISFGEGKEMEIPARGVHLRFPVCAVSRQEQLLIYGPTRNTALIVRDDLLDKEIHVTAEDLGDNRFRLRWNEARGEGYQVQRLDVHGEESEWIALENFEEDQERVYETGSMPAGRTIRLRVVSRGGTLLEGSEFASLPGETSVETKIQSLYATIWPTQELPLYADSSGETEIGTVEERVALCILGEENGFFKVRTDAGEGYIDSNCCMINLPEYLGDHCYYNITNSYSSVFLAHNRYIPGMSGICLPGYENVLQADGNFLVPLLYPVAQKFVGAIEAAEADGYKFIIYDSFRPHNTSRYMYQTVEGQLHMMVPKEEYVPATLVEFLESGVKQPTEEQQPTEPGEGPLPDELAPYVDLPGAEGEGAAEGETGNTAEEEMPSEGEGGLLEITDPDNPDAPPAEGEEGPMNYSTAIMNGMYTLTYFVSGGTSMHNLGIAMDMSIVKVETRLELEMQTKMHDLSYHSAQSNNNANAVLLQKYMRDAGFAGLVSEWWHFQDNTVRDTLKPAAMMDGISAEGWRADDRGWRYLLPDGTSYRNMNATIDGKEYTFDARGYTER